MASGVLAAALRCFLMFDANGNLPMSAGEWTAVYAVIFGAGMIVLIAVVSTFFPRSK
jgi:hypothetical protein